MGACCGCSSGPLAKTRGSCAANGFAAAAILTTLGADPGTDSTGGSSKLSPAIANEVERIEAIATAAEVLSRGTYIESVSPKNVNQMRGPAQDTSSNAHAMWA